MIRAILAIALGAVLAGAAVAKLASPRSSRAALASFGFADGPLRATAWASLIAAELGLSAGVIAGSDQAAVAAAALMAVFAALMGGAIMRGRAGAPCACFGARSKIGWTGVARNLLLAAGFATVALLPDPRLSTDQWLGIGLGVSLLACAGLTAAVLALAREVGMLRLRMAPESALEIAEEGPEIGLHIGLLDGMELSGAGDLGLAVFLSEGCQVCGALRPSLDALRGEPGLELVVLDEGIDDGLWTLFDVPGSPYAVALDASGVALAKGTFNTLAQLESVVNTAERRRSGLVPEANLG